MNKMKYQLTFLFCIFIAVQFSFSQKEYFPPKNDWQIKTPESFGIDKTKIQAAIDFANANEYSGKKDLRIAILEGFAREPYHYLAGKLRSVEVLRE